MLSDRIPDFAATGRYEPEWLERVEPGDFTLEGYTHHAPLTAPMAVEAPSATRSPGRRCGPEGWDPPRALRAPLRAPPRTGKAGSARPRSCEALPN